jgi:hypothetical protein
VIFECTSPLVTAPAKQLPKRYIYSYAKTDWTALNKHLQSKNWHDILQNKSIDSSWHEIHRILRSGIEQTTPKKLIKPSYHKKWFNPAILPLLNQKKAAWNNLCSVSTPAAWRHYRFKRNTYNRALRRCKIEHAKSIEDSIDEAKFNPRQFWRLANT